MPAEFKYPEASMERTMHAPSVNNTTGTGAVWECRAKFSAIGIPTPPRSSQRQRRNLHRRTRPHGWKGGAR